MSHLAQILLTLGGLLLVGLVTDLLGRRTFLPRVTSLLVLGFLIGPSAFDLLPDPSEEWFTLFATMALVMVGFLLGGEASARLATGARTGSALDVGGGGRGDGGGHVPRPAAARHSCGRRAAPGRHRARHGPRSDHRCRARGQGGRTLY